ncbi:MAG: flagellar protein FliT [Rhodocyclaceae bacterium]|nr:flagellar protein FliT [Rhodocyclaceae bacterium]
MSASQVIANYESLAALTGQMRNAAVRGEWDPLISIEQERSKLVAAMQSLDAEAQLDEAALRRKDQLINEILAGDAEIRNLTQAWMGEFQLSMQSNFQELRLLREYGR